MEEQTTKNEVKDKNLSNSELKKKPKKFNGFLRNNQKKHVKKPHKEKSSQELTLETTDTIIDTEDNNIESTIKKTYIKESQEEYEIFTFLRQRTGFNENKFWDNLSTVLKEKSFNQISRSHLSLISYSVLHEADTVFEKLLNTFGKEINNEEYINYVFKYGIHKNPNIINIALHFYEKNFLIEENFLIQFIKDIAHISYRSENNDIFLNWLETKMNDNLLNLFWTECFKNNNIPLIQKSIKHQFFSNFLKNNQNSFESFIENSGRKFEITQALNLNKNIKKVSIKVDNNIEPAKIDSANNLLITDNFEPKIWLSDKKEQFKVIEENLSDKKPTEVIIKRKRKIA